MGAHKFTVAAACSFALFSLAASAPLRGTQQADLLRSPQGVTDYEARRSLTWSHGLL